MNYAKAATICRAALRIGPLTACSTGWQFGRRIFSHRTVKWLIDRGEAVRDGNFVRAV